MARANKRRTRPKRLRPFFSYYGAKWRLAPLYPRPEYGTVVEPFAGSACYSLLHHKRDVVLVDKDPAIAGLWRYLIGATPEQIARLPVLKPGANVDDFDLNEAERSLIGYWLGFAHAHPGRSMTRGLYARRQNRGGWATWGPEIKAMIISQLPAIKHWTVVNSSYEDLEHDQPATWFVDPPYVDGGDQYRCGVDGIDFKHLGDWCRARPGQVIACERASETWLPFEPLGALDGPNGPTYTEGIFHHFNPVP